MTRIANPVSLLRVLELAKSQGSHFAEGAIAELSTLMDRNYAFRPEPAGVKIVEIKIDTTADPRDRWIPGLPGVSMSEKDLHEKYEFLTSHNNTIWHREKRKPLFQN